MRYHSHGMETKKHLTLELAGSIKSALKEAKVEQHNISSDILNSICNVVEAIFIHGLRRSFFIKESFPEKYPQPNFWPMIQKFVPRHVRQVLSTFTQIRTDVGRSRSWLRLCLNEGDLEHYVSSFDREPDVLKKYYHRYSYLRDREQIEVFKEYLKGVAQIAMKLPVNSSVLNAWTPSPLKLAGISVLSRPAVFGQSIPEMEEMNDVPVAMEALDALDYDGFEGGSPFSTLRAPSPGDGGPSLYDEMSEAGLDDGQSSHFPDSSPPGSSIGGMSDVTDTDVSHRSLLDARFDQLLRSMGSNPDRDFLDSLGSPRFPMSPSLASMGEGQDGRFNGSLDMGYNRNGNHGAVGVSPLTTTEVTVIRPSSRRDRLPVNSTKTTRDLKPLDKNRLPISGLVKKSNSSNQLLINRVETTTDKTSSNLNRSSVFSAGSVPNDSAPEISRDHRTPGKPEIGFKIGDESNLPNGALVSGASGTVNGENGHQIPDLKMADSTSEVSMAPDSAAPASVDELAVVIDEGDSGRFKGSGPAPAVREQPSDDRLSPEFRERQIKDSPNSGSLDSSVDCTPKPPPCTPVFENSDSHEGYGKRSGKFSLLNEHEESSVENSGTKILSNREEGVNNGSDHPAVFDISFDGVESDKIDRRPGNVDDRLGTLGSAGSSFQSGELPRNEVGGLLLPSSARQNMAVAGTSSGQQSHSRYSSTSEAGSTASFSYSPGNSLLRRDGWSSGFVSNPSGEQSFQSLLHSTLKNAELSSSPANVVERPSDGTMTMVVPEVGTMASPETYSCPGGAINEPVDTSEYDILPDVGEGGGSTDSNMKSMIALLAEFAGELGLDKQNFKCKSCKRLIGLMYGSFKTCSYDGAYYCGECHVDQMSPIPARVIFSWDLKPRPVSRATKTFLDQYQDEPLIEVERLNSAIYDYVPAMKEIMLMRKELSFLAMYLLTCKESAAEDLRKRLWPKEYLFEKIHLYSFSDLMDASTGALHKTVRSLIDFSRSHVFDCRLCVQKGFVCELCNDPRIIYPFQMDVTSRCEMCFSVFHKNCFQGVPCPKCKRREMVMKQSDPPATDAPDGRPLGSHPGAGSSSKPDLWCEDFVMNAEPRKSSCAATVGT